MSSDLDEVITRMGRLSLADLKKVQMMAMHLITSKGKYELSGHKEVDGEEDETFLLYTQISYVLADHGIDTLPWEIFKKTGSHRELVRKIKQVEWYTKKNFNNPSRRNRQRLYRIYIRITVDCIKNSPYMRLSVGAVIRNLHRVSEFMTDAFPGYAENGLLPMVLDLADDRKRKEI